MSKFELFLQINAKLPSVSDVERVDFLTANGNLVRSVANAEGQQKSLKIFNYLATVYQNEFDKRAQEKALELYAEVVDDAKANPGAHPNVDFVLEALEKGLKYTCQIHYFDE